MLSRNNLMAHSARTMILALQGLDLAARVPEGATSVSIRLPGGEFFVNAPMAHGLTGSQGHVHMSLNEHEAGFFRVADHPSLRDALIHALRTGVDQAIERLTEMQHDFEAAAMAEEMAAQEVAGDDQG